MRDILSDLEAGPQLSDPDPVRRAQSALKRPLPKRFYREAGVAGTEEGHAVLLDGKAVRTPGHARLVMPTEASAKLVAAEFDAQGETIDPSTMPALRLANTVIDGVASDPQAVLEDILRFSSSDLVCYRADAPEGLVQRQAEAWDPVIDWARRALSARLFLAEGVIHVEQPREAIAAIGVHLSQRADPFRLGCLHVMTTLTGSALLALAVDMGELSADEAWNAAHVDEDWQAAQWGEDQEAMARRAYRRREFDGACALLVAVGEP